MRKNPHPSPALATRFGPVGSPLPWIRQDEFSKKISFFLENWKNPENPENPDFLENPEFSRKVAIFWKIRGSPQGTGRMARNGQFRSKFDQIWSNLAKFGQIWPNLTLPDGQILPRRGQNSVKWPNSLSTILGCTRGRSRYLFFSDDRIHSHGLSKREPGPFFVKFSQNLTNFHKILIKFRFSSKPQGYPVFFGKSGFCDFFEKFWIFEISRKWEKRMFLLVRTHNISSWL